MTAKTIRISATSSLDDEDVKTVDASLFGAITQLDTLAGVDREVLWGTLEIEIERRQIEESTFIDNVSRINNDNRILVSALAVLK